MQCESCNKAIPSTMRGAIANNSCPWCAEDLMSPDKAEQYFNLLNILDEATFTNKGSVDIKIREKVAALIIENFLFMLIEKEQVEDLVVIEDDLEAVDEDVLEVSMLKKKVSKKATKAPKKVSKKVSKAKKAVKKVAKKAATKNPDGVQTVSSTGKPMNQLSVGDEGEARSMDLGSIGSTYSDVKSNPPPQGGFSIMDYQEAQSSDTFRPSTAQSAEDILARYPGQSIEEVMASMQKDAAAAERSRPKKSTNTGIKRL